MANRFDESRRGKQDTELKKLGDLWGHNHYLGNLAKARPEIPAVKTFISSPQGMLSLVLNCIDRLNVYTTAAHFAEFAGEEAAESWKEIVNLLYELLGKGAQS